MEVWMHQLLQWLALPQFGLSTVFIVALVSATLLPLGSEPAVAGLLQLNPDLFWQAILVATRMACQNSSGLSLSRPTTTGSDPSGSKVADTSATIKTVLSPNCGSANHASN